MKSGVFPAPVAKGAICARSQVLSVLLLALGLGLAWLTPSAQAQTESAEPRAGTTDPYENPSSLLYRAKTVIPWQFNSHCPNVTADNNPVTSAVNAIRFHTNVMTAPGTDNPYPRSYDPGGLVYDPAGAEHHLNGVSWTEYSGDFSGYIFEGEFCVFPRLVYGPIDENGVDQSQNPDHERYGFTNGTTFILKIPPNWNGVLIKMAHGGGAGSKGHLGDRPHDEYHFLKEGYAYFSLLASGYSMKDTNHNNLDFWGPPDDIPCGNFPYGGGELEQVAMFHRDTIMVIKNLCRIVTGRPVTRTIMITHSRSGHLAGTFSFGVLPLDGIADPMFVLYDGGNYLTPYANVPKLPPDFLEDNPDYEGLDAEKVFDGFINYSNWNANLAFMKVNGFRFDPRIPASSAPHFFYDGTSDEWELGLFGLLHAYLLDTARKTKVDGVTYEEYWPVPNDMIFTYHLENSPHMPSDHVWATGANGSGWYVRINPDGSLDVNREGRGEELNWLMGRVAEAGQIPSHWWEDMNWWGMSIYLSYKGPFLAGFSHQLLVNMCEYLNKGRRPPTSLIDSYWVSGNRSWPKISYLYEQSFSPSLPDLDPPRDFILGFIEEPPWDFGPVVVLEIEDVRQDDPWPWLGFQGMFGDALDYVIANNTIDYTPATVVLPEDAARLGTYRYFSSGGWMQISHLFTETELANGYRDAGGNLIPFAFNADGSPRTFEGYRNRGEYISTLTASVNDLVKRRLFDAHLGRKLVAKAAQSEFPPFRRGDPNVDGTLDLSDTVFVLNNLFLGAGTITCEKAVDANDDGEVDISDPVFLLIYQFLGGPAPDEPFGSCGWDSTSDPLTCESFGDCQ